MTRIQGWILGISLGAGALVLRCALAGAALLLLGGLSPARGQGKVLVPGDPPLMREVVDLYQAIWEWYCDLALTPAQRGQHRAHFIAWWRKQDGASKQRALAGYRDMEKRWRGLLEMEGTERDRQRARLRDRWLADLRTSADLEDRLLASIYDAAYRPGGPKNPVLVRGDPPLTRQMADLNSDVTELLLDLRLTPEQREKARHLLIADWKAMPAAKKREWAKLTAAWAELPTWSNYKCNLQRALVQRKLLEEMRKDKTSQLDPWLLGLYAAACKPGSERNPVLVEGDPPLTQLLVDRHADYLEVMLDLSVSGGFTDAQRKALQGYVVKDWKKMMPKDRQGLLTDLKRWADAVARGAGEARKCIAALRPKLLAQLRTTRGDPRSQWLLEVVAQERKRFELLSRMQRQLHETQMNTIRNIAPSGSWEYNGSTGHYDRWVPNR